MSATNYLKNAALPGIDELLAHSGLQRAPSVSSRVLGSAGLLGLGALVGAGLAIWIGSPRVRKQLSTALTNGIDQVSSKISEGLGTPRGNGLATNAHPLAR